MLLLVLTSVLVAALAMTTGAAGATTDGNATLELVENTTTDETVTVDLRTSATNVKGYQANVTYDPDVLAVRSVEGVALNDPETNDDRSGMVKFTQSQTHGVDEPTLATITFDVVGDGETTLEFVEGENETSVNDGEGESIDVTLEGLTVDTAADESGGIGGIGGGGGDGEDTAESDTDDAETDDDDADEDDEATGGDDTTGNETTDDERPETGDEEDASDETGDDEQPSDDDDSGTFGDATPLVSDGIAALVLGALVVLTGGRLLRWRQ